MQHEKKRLRLAPAERIEAILVVALDLAKKEGYRKVTRAMVAEAAECSTGLISTYFGDAQRFHDSLLRAAVHREVIEVVLQGLAVNDPIAVAAPHALKERAKAILSVK